MAYVIYLVEPRRAGYVHHKKENVIACGWDMLSQPLVLLGFVIR
jgi:hypothetical protein